MTRDYDEISDRMARERSDRAAKECERRECAAFLEMLADSGAYDAETLRRAASHMREREEWEEIIRARTVAKKPLPWEAT